MVVALPLMRMTNEKYVDLGQPSRIWAVGAIHGELSRLIALHDHLATRFAAGDKLVYLGNFVGEHSACNMETLEELLVFRSALLSKTGADLSDIVYLRGTMEEAWQRLLRLQFAPQPLRAVERLQDAKVEAYLRLHNVSVNDTKSIARAGSIVITRWTNKLRDLQRRIPGLDQLISCTRRAAVTQVSESTVKQLLFVPSGFDMTRRLDDQGDALWSGSFVYSDEAVEQYARIVRGFDPNDMGVSVDDLGVTLDGRCGNGGPLVCATFDLKGGVDELITVGDGGAVKTIRPLPAVESSESSVLPSAAMQQESFSFA